VTIWIEPEFVNERTGADVLAVSPRTFASLVSRGDIQRVKVPGLRRNVYSLADIRALAAKWRATDRKVESVEAAGAGL
jgi:hypothetical protein